MASLIKKNNNKWEIRWTDYENGTRPSITFKGTKSQAEAETRKWSSFEKQVKNGLIDNRINIKVNLDLLYNWYFSNNSRNPVGLQWKNLRRERPLSEKTVYIQRKAFKNFIKAF